MKDVLSRHWPSGVIAILIGIAAFLSAHSFNSFVKANEACHVQIELMNSRFIELNSRVATLETSLPFVRSAMEKNMATIEKMADDVQDIKVLLFSTVKKRTAERGDER